MAQQFGDFFRSFVEYDTKNGNGGGRNIMRIRVHIDIRKPFKRKKKLLISSNRSTYATFKYEKLSLFCFVCCILGHADNFCLVRLRN